MNNTTESQITSGKAESTIDTPELESLLEDLVNTEGPVAKQRLIAHIEALREKDREEARKSAFNPDWDRTEALQESLREHMALATKWKERAEKAEADRDQWKANHVEVLGMLHMERAARQAPDLSKLVRYKIMGSDGLRPVAGGGLVTFADVQALLSPAQQEPAKTEGCAGFQGKPVSTCGPCEGKGCDFEAASATDTAKALQDAAIFGTGATIGGKHVPYAELTAQATPSLPSTTDEVIAFIGSNFSSSHTQGDKADWRYQVSVHDLLSAFSEWQDFPVAQDTPDGREQREQAQRERMQARFTDRKLTPATADFDLPAPNDATPEGGITRYSPAIIGVIACMRDNPKGSYVRYADHRAALAATQQAAEPVYQVRNKGCDWEDVSKEGYEAAQQGEGSTLYEFRTLYRAAPPQQVGESGLPG